MNPAWKPNNLVYCNYKNLKNIRTKRIVYITNKDEAIVISSTTIEHFRGMKNLWNSDFYGWKLVKQFPGYTEAVLWAHDKIEEILKGKHDANS